MIKTADLTAMKHNSDAILAINAKMVTKKSEPQPQRVQERLDKEPVKALKELLDK